VKTLLLLRHAKSSWDDPGLVDHDRPLAPRGVRAAEKVAEHLDRSGLRPDLVLCSSARRTRQTLEALEPILGDLVDVRIENGLYGASSHELLRRLHAVDAAVSTALVIGHNPGLEDLAVDLAGDGEPEALAELHTKFPTAALAVFGLGENEWADLRRECARLTEIVLPRKLPG
jgi:phosphohistidine phosphatase